MHWQFFIAFASVASTRDVGVLKQLVKPSIILIVLLSETSSPLHSRRSWILLIPVIAPTRMTQGIPESRTSATILVSARHGFQKPFPFSVLCPTTTASAVRPRGTSSSGGLTRMDTTSTHHRMGSSSTMLVDPFWAI